MKHCLIFLSIFFCGITGGYSQTGVYKTYEDYTNNRIEPMQDTIGFIEFSLGSTLKFLNPENTEVKYKPKEIWGFLFKGSLFRTDGNITLYVADTGKIFYFENGGAHIRMLRKDVNYAVTATGELAYLSNELNGKLYRMPEFANGATFVVGNRKQYNEFKRKYPDHEDFYDCLGNSVDYHEMRKCAKDYNARSRKKKK